MRHRSVGPESGFMLIAVMIFVLVLTLVGLSIFTMGGYEAGFVGGEQRAAQSYFAARSALVRSQAVLQAMQDMDLVRQNLPPGVLRAVAIQNGDSTGDITWYAKVTNPAQQRVTLDVTAQVGDEPRRLKMLYEPLTVGGQSLGLLVSRGAIEAFSPVTLSGPVRQSGNDLLWRSQVAGPYTVVVADVVPPDIEGFIEAKKADPSVQDMSGRGSGHYDLTDGVYYSDYDNDDWSFYDRSSSPELNVTGTVVWLAEHGIWFEKPVEIKLQTPGSRLVIISKRGGPGAGDYGVRFQRGIKQSAVPVVIATDGKVAIGENASFATPPAISDIAILSDGVYLRQVALSYNAATMDGLIQDLQAQTKYPGAPAGIFGVLAPVQAGWSDLSHPIN